MPVTIPVAFTVATRLLLLLHEPPPITSVKLVVDPPHTVAVPVIDPAVTPGFTVTTNDAVPEDVT